MERLEEQGKWGNSKKVMRTDYDYTGKRAMRADVWAAVAYPQLVSGGVSESHKSKWLVKVGVSMGVTP